MAKIPTMDEMAKQLAENALDNFLCDGKSLREWMRIIASGDAISREAVLNLTKELRFNSVKGMEDYCYRCIDPNDVEELPPIQPKANVGKWVEMGTNDDGTHNICCGACGLGKIKSKGAANSNYTKEKYKFCPNCGVKMEVE